MHLISPTINEIKKLKIERQESGDSEMEDASRDPGDPPVFIFMPKKVHLVKMIIKSVTDPSKIQKKKTLLKLENE